MELLEVLSHINPSRLSYQEWIDVGMALKHEGFACSDWDRWSMPDERYQPGVCESKWESFKEGAYELVTAGTIVHLAMEQGWMPPQKVSDGHAVDWSENVSAKFVPDLDQLEVEEIPSLYSKWDPIREISTFLKILFKDEDIIGYVLNATYSEQESRWLLERGVSSRSSGSILDDLDRYKKIPLALGTPNQEAGAWIRVNPLDGSGISDRNVTDFRYVLVESDSLDIRTQYSLLKQLELPIATLVHSGGKSLHAIVKVDASSWRQYKERVDFIFKVCQENGLQIDKANKNPSRLSRLPGFMRKGQKQYLVATNIGQPDFASWQEYVEGLNDDLPEINSLDDMMTKGFPELKPEFWEGVARVGSKCLIVGPSKAGKSMFLIRMGISIAEGLPLMGRQMIQGPCCLINFEIPEAEYWQRIRQVYDSMEIEPTPQGRKNLRVWNMRGKSDRLDRLATILIRRLKRSSEQYTAVVVDPIYKTITGDENSAAEMAHFCNCLDRICGDLQTTLIYAHHFSKGAQGGKKAIDRASGSGVFGRDPDAIVTFTELMHNDKDREFHANKLACLEYQKVLRKYGGWTNEDFPEDLKWDPEWLHDEAQKTGITAEEMEDLNTWIQLEQAKILKRNAFRMEMTLRSFAEPDPVNLFYEYPLHVEDTAGILQDALLEGVYQPEEVRRLGLERGHRSIQEKASQNVKDLEKLIQERGEISIKDAAEILEAHKNTVRNWAKKSSRIQLEDGIMSLSTSTKR